jgi:hypothetical protein
VVAVTMPAPSLSHSWYPSWCCGGEDCKQVDEIEYLPDGSMLVHAGLMHVVVPQGFFLQPSPVDQAHVCTYKMPAGQYVPRCVFLPGTT